ncbi:MAG: lipid kinase [Ectothiorhodospiraceae bacterium]|nr:lipid kinase [Ectothiorhodospiraceae bacterium]
MKPSRSAPESRPLLLLANPGAGRHEDDPISKAIQTLEEAGYNCTQRAPAGVEELVDAAASGRRDYDIVVIAGGDGTVHAALPGLIGDGAPVGILPLGTANDLARTLGIPTEPAEAAAVIAAGHSRRIDVSRFNGDYFINVAHVGVGARAKQKVTTERKQRWRALSYPLSLLETLWNYRPFRVRITVDGETRRFWAVHVAIGNGRYSGGGVPVSEEADIADGLMDICCVRATDSWRLLRAAVTVMRGTAGAKEVWRATGKRMELHTRRRHRITADGETAGHTPATFTIQPGAITVIIPEGDTDAA